MRNAIKSFLANLLLKDEQASLRIQQASLEASHVEFEAYKKSLTVEDLVREQLKGFDPKLLDDATDLPEVLGDVTAQEPFLAAMKSLNENDSLWTLVAYLTRNQILFSAKEAQDLASINFGRATINGWSLLREEVERLTTVFKARHAAEPEFDEHEVL